MGKIIAAALLFSSLAIAQYSPPLGGGSSSGNVIVNGTTCTIGSSCTVTTTPCGATTQIQYNNAGACGASATFTYTPVTETVLTGVPISSLCAYCQAYLPFPVTSGNPRLDGIDINPDISANAGVIRGIVQYTGDHAGDSLTPSAVYAVAFGDPGTGNTLPLLRGADFDAVVAGDGHFGRVVGLFSYVEGYGPMGSSPVIDEINSVYIAVADGPGVVNAYGIRIATMDGGASGERAGILIDDQASGAFAIKTGSGAVQFGGRLQINSILFAALGAPSNASEYYCSDCTVTSAVDDTCVGAGAGAWAQRIAGAWKCNI